MSLPGDVRNIRTPEKCEYCSYPAEHELCTESDSFGDEWTPVCKKHLPDPSKKLVGSCECCHAVDVVIVPTRDPEEIHGCITYKCPECLLIHYQYSNSLMDDLEDDDDSNDWDDWTEDEMYNDRVMDNDEEI
jgi:hypothetical protein